MNRSWINIDKEAMLEGIAEYKLRQSQPKHNHTSILYNTVARYSQMPTIIVKHRKISKPRLPKPCLPIFSLED